ncbi:penicillin-binding transpeptidase domain-containing protein, partial [Corynebacterium heidelbergense]
PLDMASALATLANKGKYFRPHFVEKVENSEGEVLLDNSKPNGEQVVKPEVANNVIAAMGPIAAYSNGNSLAGGRPSASKTGTAQLGDTGENKDAWMIGATPQLATAVWVGAKDGAAIHNQYGGIMYGSGTPATIWKNTMDTALQNADVESFTDEAASANSASTRSYNSYSGGTGAGGTGTGGATGAGTGAGTQPAPAQQQAPPPPAPAPAPAPG